MSGVNKQILVGHLGKAPKISTSRTGARYATLRVATSESYRDKATGERKERTEWHDVVIYNERLVEVAEKYLVSGSKVYVEGQTCHREWTDEKGVKRRITEVVLRQYRGELARLDRAEHAPAPDEDSYGTTTTRDAGPAGDDDIPL